MRIIAIKTSRIPNRIYLKFDNGFFLPFALDHFVEYHLQKDVDISEISFNQLVNISLHSLLTDYSLRQIALSSKNEVVLTRKLKIKYHYFLKKYKLEPKAIEAGLIQQVVDSLKSKGLLNQDNFVADYISRHPLKSEKEILFLLGKQGVSRNQIPDGLFSPEGEAAKVKRLIEKKFRNPIDLADNSKTIGLINYLVRKGFAFGLVKSLIDDYRFGR